MKPYATHYKFSLCSIIKMSDEIAVASLLMAILAILYGAWYPEIVKVINTETPRHDKGIDLKIAQEIRNTKSLPLLFLSILTSIIFIPSLITIICDAISFHHEFSISAFKKYSVVKTAFCLVIISCIIISYHIIVTHIQLNEKCKSLK